MRRLSSFAGILLILALGAGLLVYQRKHIQKHLPLAAAELAVAEREGPGLLESIGLPEGATPYDEGLKSYPVESRNSMWQGAKMRVRWERTWVMPGDHDSVEAWYADRLAQQGWRPFTIGVPSSVERLYWKDKWLVTFQRRADFSTDRDPTVRVAVILDWDYWHDLGR